MKFLNPMRLRDLAQAKVSMTDFDIAKQRVQLDCLCSIGSKKVLIEESTVLAPSARPN